MAQQTGCRQRRDRVSVDSPTPLARRSCPSRGTTSDNLYGALCGQRVAPVVGAQLMSKRPARRPAALADTIARGQQSAQPPTSQTPRGRAPRIMYIERKAGSLTGPARIGRVTFNRTRRTIFYRDQVFHRIVGGGFKSNYYDQATGENYWISGCKRRGGDQLYATNVPIEIDDDVRVEYWRDIRNMPERINERTA